MEDAAKTLSNELLNTVRSIIDGNQVKGDELELVSSRVEPFDLFITVKWKFYAKWSDYKIAGGRASSHHYGYDYNKFDEHHECNLRKASNDRSLREKFLNYKKNEGVRGLLNSDGNKTAIDLGTHSYRHDCGNCNAGGVVTCGACGGSGWNFCYSCGGTGKVKQFYTEYDSYSKRTIHCTRWVNCWGCASTGRVTCNGCGGSGVVTCPSCNGLLYFTVYRSSNVSAKPTIYYKVEGKLYQDEILDIILNKKLSFVFSRVDFTDFQTSSSDFNIEQFVYYGNSYATEVTTSLRSEYYTIAGWGIPITTFIRPPIFDQLFKEEIAELLEIKNQKEKVRKQAAIKFFDHFIDQPALSSALKTIAIERTKDEMDASQIITKACYGYISQEASQTFSDGVTAILDKVSPPYHNLTWVIWGILSLVFVLLWTESAFENFIFNNGFQWIDFFTYGLYSLFGLLVFFTIFTIPIIIIDAIIIIYRRRNVPKQYRQIMRHDEVYKKVLMAASTAWLIGGIYGAFAGNNIVPQLNYQPFTWAYQSLLTNEQKTQFDETCLKLLKPVHYYPGACEYLKQKNPMTKIIEKRELRQSLLDNIKNDYISENEKVYALQTLLNQTYPDVEVDGIYGKTTQSKSVKYLKSQSVPIDDDANLNEIIKAFKDVE